MIPDYIKPLLRTTLTVTGYIKYINKSDQVKKSVVYPKSGERKRYYEYTIVFIEHNGICILPYIKVKWIKTDLPIKLNKGDKVELVGKLVPYIDNKDIIDTSLESMSYKLSHVKLVRRI